MTRNTLVLLAAGGSAALMLAALGFQHIGEMAPCKLCIWQRYPHVAAILIGLLIIALSVKGTALRALTALGALAALITAAIGAYHTGVERGWWQGPTSCSGGDMSQLSPGDLLNQIMAAPLVRCDQVPWELFGLSMASWNMLASLALAVFWIAALRRA